MDLTFRNYYIICYISRIKNKNHISRCRKTLDRIQHLFMVKKQTRNRKKHGSTWQKSSNKKTKKHLTALKLNRQRMSAFFLRSERRQHVCSHHCSLTLNAEVLARTNRRGQNEISIQVGKEEGKPSIFVDDMISYRIHCKESTRNHNKWVWHSKGSGVRIW